jgi:hypothetical protein
MCPAGSGEETTAKARHEDRNAAPTQTREHGRSTRRLSSRLTSGRSSTAAEDAHFFTDAQHEWDERRQSQGFGVGPMPGPTEAESPVVLWVESFC